MRHPESLEIKLWDALKNATQTLEEVDLRQIWQILEAIIGKLNSTDQLRVAAEAIAQITTLFQERSSLIFEDLQASTDEEGPPMSDDAFDRYVRQSMAIDFESFIEPLPGLPRKPTDRSLTPVLEENSIAAVVEKEALLQVLEQQVLEQQAWEQQAWEQAADNSLSFEQAIAIAHDEEVSVWSGMIAAYLTQQKSDRVCLEELQQALPLSLIEIWLGLLLGGYSLRGVMATDSLQVARSETELQRTYFYPAEIWCDRLSVTS